MTKTGTLPFLPEEFVLNDSSFRPDEISVDGDLGNIQDGFLQGLVDRHTNGDWGEVDDTTIRNNQKVLLERNGILEARYLGQSGRLFKIRTCFGKRTLTFVSC